jgi:phage tail sheath protein FI
MIVDLRNKGVVKDHAAVFYPRLTYNNNGLLKTIGPSGVIAGLMARTDADRGVWKAPAGIEADLRDVLGVDVKLTDRENGVLNKKGVNCLRAFPTGLVNWGARTLDGDDDIGSEWKYIPIRRLALMLEESLYRGTQWVVFEPNDEPLWAKIRLNVNAFMMSLFSQGAFQGTSPSQAFFVKCDSQTTTANDQNEGIVNIVVGFAPLKPAEFVVITIQQIAGDL